MRARDRPCGPLQGRADAGLAFPERLPLVQQDRQTHERRGIAGVQPLPGFEQLGRLVRITLAMLQIRQAVEGALGSQGPACAGPRPWPARLQVVRPARAWR